MTMNLLVHRAAGLAEVPLALGVVAQAAVDGGMSPTAQVILASGWAIARIVAAWKNDGEGKDDDGDR